MTCSVSSWFTANPFPMMNEWDRDSTGHGLAPFSLRSICLSPWWIVFRCFRAPFFYSCAAERTLGALAVMANVQIRKVYES